VATFDLGSGEGGVSQLGMEPVLVIFTDKSVKVTEDGVNWGGIDGGEREVSGVSLSVSNSVCSFIKEVPLLEASLSDDLTEVLHILKRHPSRISVRSRLVVVSLVARVLEYITPFRGPEDGSLIAKSISGISSIVRPGLSGNSNN